MTSTELLIKINSLKTEVEKKQKEIESLTEQLKEQERKEAERLARYERRKARKMYDFIKHNSTRPIVLEYMDYEFTEDKGVKEVLRKTILRPRKYELVEINGEWGIKSKNFCVFLSYLNNIYVAFE